MKTKSVVGHDALAQWLRSRRVSVVALKPTRHSSLPALPFLLYHPPVRSPSNVQAAYLVYWVKCVHHRLQLVQRLQ